MKKKNAKAHCITRSTQQQGMPFVGHLRRNSTDIVVYSLSVVCWYIFLHYCYPVANMIPDTKGYIYWADKDTYGGFHPMGYPHFLRFIHSFSQDISVVFIAQLLIFSFASLLFYLSVTYLFSICNKYLRAVFLSTCIFFLSGFYATNVISSDSLFLSGSILMVTACIWFIKRPHVLLFLFIIISTMLCISIRHIGIIYPFIVVVVLFYGSKNRPMAIAATLFLVIIIAGYINIVSKRTEADVGVNIFSAFGGWQKANNALHIVPHMDLSKPLVHTDDAEIQIVDSFVRETYPRYKKYYPADNEVSYLFIWSDSLPLKPFMVDRIRLSKSYMSYMWNYLGKVYSDYADLIIKEHPKEYLRYYLFNNLKMLFRPDEEMFKGYFPAPDKDKNVWEWFALDKTTEAEIRKEPGLSLLKPVLRELPVMYLLLWFGFSAALIMFFTMLIQKKMNLGSKVAGMCLVFVTYIAIYCLASLFAAPISVRFLMMVRVLILAFMVICVNGFIKKIPESKGSALIDQ